jgi:hypothetical protein
MAKDKLTKPEDSEAGRTSLSGTSSGISVAQNSTSGGTDPIPPGGGTTVESPEQAADRLHSLQQQKGKRH